MPRFLHTADLHLNALRRRFPHYLVRGQWVLDAISQTAQEHECDCIVVAGDVFDQTNLTISERQLFSDWLGSLKIPALIISGNHDTRNSYATNDTCLSYLAALNLRLHLIYDGAPRIIRSVGAWWLLFPHLRYSNFEFRLMLEAMLYRTQKTDPDLPVVAILHDAISGARVDTGVELEGHLRLYEDLGVTYWALGDIHHHQQMLPNAWYPGSPHQVNFGEQLGKGVLIVDTDYPEDPEFVHLATPYPLVTVNTVPDAGTDWPLFCRFAGDLPTDIAVPEHVVWQPPERDTAEISYGRAKVPLLHGLRQKLLDLDVDEDLFEQTETLAKEMAEEIGLDLE